MMRLGRRAALPVMFLLLTSAATAYAECAFDARASIVDHPVRDSIGGVDLS